MVASKSRAQAFPDGFQVLRDPAMPKKRGLAATKLLGRVRAGWRFWWKALCAPFVSAGALFQFVALAASAIFLTAIFGDSVLVERLPKLVESLWTVILAVPVWAVLNAAVVPFQIFKAEKRMGAWNGPRFVYLQPLQLSASEIQESGTVVESILRFDDIPPGAVVDYRIDIDGPAQRVNSIVFGAIFFKPASDIIRSTRFLPRGRVVVRKDGSLRLLCYMQPATVPIQIRVYALGWEIDPTICFDYTDEQKGFRFVVRPPESEAT